MKLVTFRIRNYRSVNDSGDIAVGKLTSLVGRNEAGKTNLLLALQTLNPASGLKNLAPIKDFPRQRRLSECTDDTAVVSTTWELNQREQGELLAMFPRATAVTQVEIGRNYKAVQWVRFVDLKPVAFSAEQVTAQLGRLAAAVKMEVEKRESALQIQPQGALDQLTSQLSIRSAPNDWASAAASALASIRKALAASAISLPEKDDALISELEATAAQIMKKSPLGRRHAIGLLDFFPSLSMLMSTLN